MIRQLVGFFGYMVLFAALLFLPVGTTHWPRAWVLLGVLFVVRGVSIIQLWRVQRSLLEERARLPWHAEQPPADRVLLIAAMASFAGLIAFAARDAWRHPRIGESLAWPSAFVPTIGLLAFAGGWWLVHLALRANAFAVTVVRHQEERGQVVIDSGPYALVRHPLYAGLLPVMAGLCLWLGSAAGLIAVLIPVGVLVIRIVLEERLLRTRLPEYAAYAGRVRWRLVPGVW